MEADVEGPVDIMIRDDVMQENESWKHLDYQMLVWIAASVEVIIQVLVVMCQSSWCIENAS